MGCDFGPGVIKDIRFIMSDAEGDDVPAAGAAAASMDIYEALQEVLKTALINDGLCRGVKEATKALGSSQSLVYLPVSISLHQYPSVSISLQHVSPGRPHPRPAGCIHCGQ